MDFLALVLKDGFLNSDRMVAALQPLILHTARNGKKRETDCRLLFALARKSPYARRVCQEEYDVLLANAHSALVQKNFPLFVALLEVGLLLDDGPGGERFLQLLAAAGTLDFLVAILTTSVCEEELSAILKLLRKALPLWDETFGPTTPGGMTLHVAERLVKQNEDVHRMRAERAIPASVVEELERKLAKAHATIDSSNTQLREKDLGLKKLNDTLHTCTKEMIQYGEALEELRDVKEQLAAERESNGRGLLVGEGELCASVTVGAQLLLLCGYVGWLCPCAGQGSFWEGRRREDEGHVLLHAETSLVEGRRPYSSIRFTLFPSHQE